MPQGNDCNSSDYIGWAKSRDYTPCTAIARSHTLFDDRNIQGVSGSFYSPHGKFDMHFRSVDTFISSSFDFSGQLKIRMDKSEQRIRIKYFSMKDFGSRLIYHELKSFLHDSACNLSAVEK
jgi:hypothetical protein